MPIVHIATVADTAVAAVAATVVRARCAVDAVLHSQKMC